MELWCISAKISVNRNTPVANYVMFLMYYHFIDWKTSWYNSVQFQTTTSAHICSPAWWFSGIMLFFVIVFYSRQFHSPNKFYKIWNIRMLESEILYKIFCNDTECHSIHHLYLCSKSFSCLISLKSDSHI